MTTTNTDILERATAELVDALVSHGVPSLLLKGPVFSRWLYDDGVPRAYNDIDLLVQEDRRRLAEQRLRELGFRLAPISRRDWEAVPHAIGWERGAVEVDLHWTLWAAEAAPATVWHELQADAQELRVGGAEVPSAGPRTRAMLVAVHAARHRSPRSRWLMRRARRTLPGPWSGAHRTNGVPPPSSLVGSDWLMPLRWGCARFRRARSSPPACGCPTVPAR